MFWIFAAVDVKTVVRLFKVDEMVKRLFPESSTRQQLILVSSTNFRSESSSHTWDSVLNTMTSALVVLHYINMNDCKSDCEMFLL